MVAARVGHGESEYPAAGSAVKVFPMTRSALALAGWILFALVAFGWRTYVQVRRHGDTGWRIRPGGGPVAVVAHGSFVASLVLSLAAPTAALVLGGAHRPGGVAALAGDGVVGGVAFALGLAAMLAGGVLAVRAQVDMGASWRIGVEEGERTELVTDGLFEQVRNPIFTGMLLAVAGLALVVPSAPALAAVATAVLGLELQVRRVEEPHLLATHGDAYRRWAGRTGRFIPRLGRI